MNGTSKLKVAAETYCVVLESTEQLTDCYKVCECLGRMIVAAVSSIDNRAGRIFAGKKCCTLFWSSHGYYVGIA